MAMDRKEFDTWVVENGTGRIEWMTGHIFRKYKRRTRRTQLAGVT